MNKGRFSIFTDESVFKGAFYIRLITFNCFIFPIPYYLFPILKDMLNIQHKHQNKMQPQVENI